VKRYRLVGEGGHEYVTFGEKLGGRENGGGEKIVSVGTEREL